MNGLSQIYKSVDSRSIVEKMEEKGFEFEGVKTTNTRKPEHIGHQKHMMIFKSPFEIDDNNYIRALIVNSYNGLTSIQFNLGVYRIVCRNGLIVGDDLFKMRAVHKGNIIDQVEEATEAMAESSKKVVEFVQLMQDTNYTPEEEEQFILSAIEFRHPKALEGPVKPFDYTSQFQAKREQDVDTTVYNLYNRVQEKLIGGDYHFYSANLEAMRKAKSFSGVNTMIKANQFLWSQAQQLVA